MNNGLSNKVEEEPILSKNTNRLLAEAGIRTFKGLARMKMGTFLKKVPKITVRALCSVEECLNHRKLSFIEDDTISLSKDSTISQRKLFALWGMGIVKYKDFNKFHYWKIVRILGKKVFEDYGTSSWIEKRGVVPSTSYPFFDVGFSEKTLDLLMRNRKETFEDIIDMTEFDLACLFASYNKKDKWPSYGSWAMKRVREVKYILWKHKKPNLKSMNQERKELL